MKKPAEENWMLWLLQMVNLNWKICFSFVLEFPDTKTEAVIAVFSTYFEI